jgi:hypothetical protein
MIELVILIVTGFLSVPLDTPVEHCSYKNNQLCCTWQYEEVGCYEEFTIQEVYCISKKNKYKWELEESQLVVEDKDETWHDRYIRDHCAACPECCVTTEEDTPDD